MPLFGIGYADENVQPGKLRAKATQHQMFLKNRRKAAGIGVNYPMTRSTADINQGAKPPPLTAGSGTGFLGMGGRASNY